MRLTESQRKDQGSKQPAVGRCALSALGTARLLSVHVVTSEFSSSIYRWPLHSHI